ncbi:MAG: hypothetical protein ACP5IL_09110 [Syntrophobacteraceae bacterium]
MKISKSAQLVAILLVMAMAAFASCVSQKVIIFPEIAALALGAWVMETPPWRGCSNLGLWLLPTLAALTGFLIIRFFPYSPFLMITAAFALVALQLSLLRSPLSPALSAAVLPLVVHSSSWCYPAAVCTFSGIVAGGRYGRQYFPGRRKLFRERSRDKNRRLSNEMPSTDAGPTDIVAELIYWGKLLPFVMVVLAVAVEFHWIFIAAPPLLVAFAELAKPDDSFRARPFGVLVLLCGAALLGAAWLLFMREVMHWPDCIAAGLILLSIFILYHLMGLYFPPAAALGLLPLLLPKKALLLYPLEVFAGSVLFLVLSVGCFSGKRFFLPWRLVPLSRFNWPK